MKAVFKENITINDIWKIAEMITDKMVTAIKMNPISNIDKMSLEGEWFDYLDEKLLIDNHEERKTDET